MIFSDLFKTQSKAIIYFSIGFLIILVLLALIFYSLYYDNLFFGTTLECLDIMVALSMADNVLNLFNQLHDNNVGVSLVFLAVILFNFTFMEILLGITSVSY